MYGLVCISTQCAKVYKNKKLDRGVAFPTCVSVNECVSHFSPLTIGDDVELRAGDFVKLCVFMLAKACPTSPSPFFLTNLVAE